MTVGTLHINGQEYVVLPKAEYQRLVNGAPKNGSPTASARRWHRPRSTLHALQDAQRNPEGRRPPAETGYRQRGVSERLSAVAETLVT